MSNPILTKLILKSLNESTNKYFEKINNCEFKPSKETCYTQLADIISQQIHLFIELIGKKLINLIINEILLKNEPKNYILGFEQFFNLEPNVLTSENFNLNKVPELNQVHLFQNQNSDENQENLSLTEKFVICFSNLKVTDLMIQILNQKQMVTKLKTTAYLQEMYNYKQQHDNSSFLNDSFVKAFEKDEIIKAALIKEFNESEKNVTSSKNKTIMTLTRIFNLVDEHNLLLATTNSNRGLKRSASEEENQLGIKWHKMLGDECYQVISILMKTMIKRIMENYLRNQKSSHNFNNFHGSNTPHFIPDNAFGGGGINQTC